tara:strand:+ start:314 stop:928 length:615 start_codon:yes stop_codon:yes gene_type:complete
MPKPNYQNSIIYKLCHQDDQDNENIYIGSTTNFRSRKNEHKTNCNNEKDKAHNTPIYQYIRNNGGWDEWFMIPIEVYPCNSKKELEVRERYHIELLKSKLNQAIPTRSKKEWYEDNKPIILEQQKDYYNDNQEKILEQKKQYHIDNKEKRLEYNKQYRYDNKEIIAEKKKEKVICDHCGCEVIKYHLNRHKKTNKCKNYNITKE